MNTVENLEESVRSLLDTGRRLKKERNAAVLSLEEYSLRLREARETIDELTTRMQGSGDGADVDREREKEEIIAVIQTILTRLEALLI